MKNFLYFMYDFLVPRFVTESVAIKFEDSGEITVVCRLADLQLEDDWDLIVPCKSFNFFGFALFPKVLVPEDFEK